MYWFKGKDRHLTYTYTVLVSVLIFTVGYIAFYFISEITPLNALPLRNWHIQTAYDKIYEKGILTKDGGTTYILTHRVSLEKIFYINNPTLLFEESIIPSEVFLNNRALSISYISKGYQHNTYLIAYKLPSSGISFTNTITVYYTTGNKVGWQTLPQIVSENYVKKYVLFHTIRLFITTQATSILSIIGLLILAIAYGFTQSKHLLPLSAALFLIWILSTFSIQTYLSLYYFLPIPLGLIILQQIIYRNADITESLLIISLMVVTVMIPIIPPYNPSFSPTIRLVVSILAIILTLRYIYKVSHENIPTIYWVLSLFSITLAESFLQIITTSSNILTTSCLLTSSATALLFSILGINTSTFFNTKHPANTIEELSRKNIPFTSVLIKSRGLIKQSDELINKKILSYLYPIDSYTTTATGIWIIRPEMSETEAIVWAGKLINKLRNEAQIKDVRIGILVVPSNKKARPREIFRKTVETANSASYPTFIKLDHYLE